MTVDGDGPLPVWQPGDDFPRWAAKLMEPFAAAEVGLRPQVWCPKCREQKATRYCGMKAEERGSGGVEHVKKKCKDCGQNITQAHLHLSYIGHAHITERLLQADPKWTWRPMGRDIPADVMVAAIATGDLAILQTVIKAYPPKIIEVDRGGGQVEHVMWGEVVIHDEHGDEIVLPGVGDAIGKAWDPNAVKEMIGDLLRNALMRRGTGLDLWKKEDADRAKRERAAAGSDDPVTARAAEAAALFDGGAAAIPAPAGTPRARVTRSVSVRAAPAAADTGAAAGINPEAQAAADLAWRLRLEGVSVSGLRAAAHEPAQKAKLLGLHCQAPWDRTEKVTVLKVIVRAKEELEALARSPRPSEAHAAAQDDPTGAQPTGMG